MRAELIILLCAAFVAVATWAISNLEEADLKKGVPHPPPIRAEAPTTGDQAKKETPTDYTSRRWRGNGDMPR